jgi:hypothetical protein
MIATPASPAPVARKNEVQALLTVVACGPDRGLAGLHVVGQPGAAAGEYFLPFSFGAREGGERQFAYAGLLAAIDKLRSLHIERVLIVVDDDLLVDELDRRVEPPKELFLHYVFAGCKLNEFRRAKVVAAHSARLEQLRIRTKALASTLYNAPLFAQAL